jgi:hypothetical protein
MNENFDTWPWHDATLLEMCVDRRNPGQRDEIRLRVRWPQGEEVTLLFTDCYAMKANMNFGVVAEESISSAAVIDHDALLALIRERWKSLGVSLEHLRCYRIQTASTSSEITIYANALAMF